MQVLAKNRALRCVASLGNWRLVAFVYLDGESRVFVPLGKWQRSA